MLKLEWKPVIGYENIYSVSNYGQVKSLARTIKKENGVEQKLKEKIIKPVLKDGYGSYLRVVLYKNNSLSRRPLHVLVASHFIPNPDNKPEVGHDDGDKMNCRVDNLSWETRSENMKHAWGTGLRI